MQNIDPMNKNKAIEILFPKILEALSANIPNNYWIQTDMGHGKYIQVKKLDTLDYAKKESFVFHLVKNYINMENDQICDIDYKRHTTSELMYKNIDLCFDEESLLAIVFIKTQKTSSELLMSVFS